jgi:hypothetical protein
VRDLESFKTLAVLWRITTLQNTEIEEQFEKIKDVVKRVPLKLEAGQVYNGQHESGVYDCIIWTTDALKALLKEGLLPKSDKPVGKGIPF